MCTVEIVLSILCDVYIAEWQLRNCLLYVSCTLNKNFSNVGVSHLPPGALHFLSKAMQILASEESGNHVRIYKYCIRRLVRRRWFILAKIQKLLGKITNTNMGEKWISLSYEGMNTISRYKETSFSRHLVQDGRLVAARRVTRKVFLGPIRW